MTAQGTGLAHPVLASSRTEALAHQWQGSLAASGAQVAKAQRTQMQTTEADALVRRGICLHHPAMDDPLSQ